MNRPRLPGEEGRRAHNAHQAEVFDRAAPFFLQPVPDDVQQRTARIVALAGLPAGAAVLDAGTGTGVLLPHLRAAGAGRIAGCDLSPQMLAHARARHGDGAEFILSDIVDLPPDAGPFDAVFFNAMFGNVHDQFATLRAAASLLRPGGRVIISHPMGRAWHRRLGQDHPGLDLHNLPDPQAAPSLLAAAGLELLTAVDEPDLYVLIGTKGKGEREKGKEG